MVGGGGIKRITITASDTLEGESLFRAYYVRPWEFNDNWAMFDNLTQDELEVPEQDLNIFTIRVHSKYTPDDQNEDQDDSIIQN